MIRILLVDDSSETQVLVSKSLGSAYPITWSKSLSEAWSCCHREKFDLIILDVVLPDGDGFQFCAKLQNDDLNCETPVLLLTGKTGVSHRVMGFSVGADGYLEKPFDPHELRARIEGKIRRIQRQKNSVELFRIGELRLNSGSQRVTMERTGESEEILLSPIEFRILHFMARRIDLVHSREQLISAVWGENFAISDRTVDKHISSLRKKLGPCGNYVQTVPGSGYRLNPSVEIREAG